MVARFWTIKYNELPGTVYCFTGQDEPRAVLNKGDIEATCWYSPGGRGPDSEQHVHFRGFSTSLNKTFGDLGIDSVSPNNLWQAGIHHVVVTNERAVITAKQTLTYNDLSEDLMQGVSSDFSEDFKVWEIFNLEWDKDKEVIAANHGEGGLAITLFGNVSLIHPDILINWHIVMDRLILQWENPAFREKWFEIEIET